MFTRRFITILATAGALLMLLPHQVKAGFIVRALAIAQTVHDGPNFNDAGPANASASVLSILGSASALATASPGTLGSLASAQTIGLPTLNFAATAQGNFEDTLTVRSVSLPAGTPVTLLVSQQVEGDFLVLNPRAAIGTVQSFIAAGSSISGYTLDSTGNLQDDGPILLSTQVGSSFLFRGSLTAIASTFFNVGVGGGSVTTDFYHTAHYYADPLTPGVFLTSDSGHDYSSAAVHAIPEPGSLALAGVGFLSFLGYGWWHRRRAVATRLAVV